MHGVEFWLVPGLRTGVKTYSCLWWNWMRYQDQLGLDLVERAQNMLPPPAPPWSGRRTLHVVFNLELVLTLSTTLPTNIQSNLSTIPPKIHWWWCRHFHQHWGQQPTHQRHGNVISVGAATLRILMAACHVKHGRSGWCQSLLCEPQRREAPQSSTTAVAVLLPTKIPTQT